MSDEKRNEKLRVIYVEPGKRAQTIENDEIWKTRSLWNVRNPGLISHGHEGIATIP